MTVIVFIVIFYSSLMYVSILFTGCSGTTTCPWGSGSPTSGPSCLAAITRKHSKDHRWSAQCQMEHQARGTVPDPVQPPGRTADRACSCRRRRGERRQPNRELWRPVFGRSASVWYYAWGGCQNAWQGKAKKFSSVNFMQYSSWSLFIRGGHRLIFLI